MGKMEPLVVSQLRCNATEMSSTFLDVPLCSGLLKWRNNTHTKAVLPTPPCILNALPVRIPRSRDRVMVTLAVQPRLPAKARPPGPHVLSGRGLLLKDPQCPPPFSSRARHAVSMAAGRRAPPLPRCHL